MIVDENRAVTLVGGGPLGPDDLTMSLALAPALVALDSGADACLAAGLRPQAVIGDLDSLSPAARVAFADRLHLMTEQIATDFDKGLRSISAPLVIGVGMLGGRLDHTLAGLSTLLRYADRPCVLIGAETLVFLCPPHIELTLSKGVLVSLFPLVAGRVASSGLVWPTDGIDFAPGGRLGTSNVAAGGVVTLRQEAPGMLVLVPRDALAEVARALRAAGPWPSLPRGE